MYSMAEYIMELLKVLSVAQPVAALSSLVISSEGEGGPKEPCNSIRCSDQKECLAPTLGGRPRLMAFPFSGIKLFGQALDPLLVENMDKGKVLPTAKKEAPKSRPSSFFRGSCSSFCPKDGGSHKPKRNKGSFFPPRASSPVEESLWQPDHPPKTKGTHPS